MTAPLPVRPAPRTSEPLTSYAARLADANGVARARVLLPYRHDIDVPKAELFAVADLGGLHAEAASRLTMDRYPQAIRGHGVTRRHGWRLHFAVTWICPSCTPSTGHTDLLWQTALMPVCLRCGCYLVRAEGPRVPVPANSKVLELVGILSGWAEASIDDPRLRAQLYRLRRRCQLLGPMVDAGQPAEDLDKPAVDVNAARQWGAYPSQDPTTVAALLLLAGKRLVQEKRCHLVDARKHQAAEFTNVDRDRLGWFLTRVRRHVTHDGLCPDHVPAMLPTPIGDEPRRPGQWLSSTRAAVALYLLISRASDLDSTPEVAMAVLGVAGIPSCLLIDGIYAGDGLRECDADLLGSALDELLADGLVDFRRRRDTLWPITRLPKAVGQRLRMTDSKAATAQQLALGWIWTSLTSGAMRSSRWPHIPDRDVHAFAAVLDPEIRLVLHETGQQVLADADLATIPIPHTTWPAITRRYG